MKIGELSQITGVQTWTLRRLADKGVIPCRRLPGGARRVPRSAIPEIVKRLIDCGLIDESVTTIGETK